MNYSSTLDNNFGLIIFRLKEGHDLHSVLIESFKSLETQESFKIALSEDSVNNFLSNFLIFFDQTIRKSIRYRNKLIPRKLKETKQKVSLIWSQKSIVWRIGSNPDRKRGQSMSGGSTMTEGSLFSCLSFLKTIPFGRDLNSGSFL